MCKKTYVLLNRTQLIGLLFLKEKSDYGLSFMKMRLKRLINWIRRVYNYMKAYVSKSPRAAYLN